MTTENETGNGTAALDCEQTRWFDIPPGLDILGLTDALGGWFRETLDRKTEMIMVPRGWVLQAMGQEGRLGRWMNRRSESLYVLMVREGKQLRVCVNSGEWSPEKLRQAPRGFSIRGMAADALQATGSMVEAAASVVTDLWIGPDTPDAVFRFVAGYLVENLRERIRTDPLGIDAAGSRHVEPLSDVTAAWLAGFRAEGEVLIAWLGTTTPSPEAEGVPYHFVMTSHRTGLAAVSDHRFHTYQALSHDPMSVTDKIGKDLVTVGETAFQTRTANDMLFREIAPLNVLDPAGRLLSAARLNVRHRSKHPEHLAYAAAVLRHLAGRSDDPLHRLSHLFVRQLSSMAEGGEAVTFAALDLSEAEREMVAGLPDRLQPAALARWCGDWGLTPKQRISLAGLVQAPGAAAAHGLLVRDLVTEAWETIQKREKEILVQVVADMVYARNRGLTDQAGEGIAVLESRLKRLPDETLSELLPAQDSDLTRGQGGQLLRVQILELLAELRGETESADPDTLRELARLQPLVAERLVRLSEAGAGDRSTPLAPLIRVMTPGESPPPLPGGGPAPIRRTLPEEAITTTLRHPAAREGTVIRKLQQMVATSTTPDHSAVKRFARRVSDAAHPDLAAAVAEGKRMLGIGDLDAFIAYGDDAGSGIRGYDGTPPFLLIGGESLEGAPDRVLTPAELRFLIGGELVHLYFKHERITSRDVWEGTFDKAISVVELVPVLGGYLGKLGRFGRIAGQAGSVAQKIGSAKDYLMRARDVARSAQNLYRRGMGIRPAGASPASDPDAGAPAGEAELIGAFRTLQLTADRGGLLLCGDPSAAVAAIFKQTPSLVDQRNAALAEGLSAFLSRKNEKGELIHQDLSIRIAALFSFYLSGEYTKLRRQLTTG